MIIIILAIKRKLWTALLIMYILWTLIYLKIVLNVNFVKKLI